MNDISRSEVQASMDRMEDRLSAQNTQILTAVSELRSSVNGQFEIRDRIIQAQQKALTDHEAALARLDERGNSDRFARWVAGIATLIAAIAAVLARQ